MLIRHLNEHFDPKDPILVNASFVLFDCGGNELVSNLGQIAFKQPATVFLSNAKFCQQGPFQNVSTFITLNCQYPQEKLKIKGPKSMLLSCRNEMEAREVRKQTKFDTYIVDPAEDGAKYQSEEFLQLAALVFQKLGYQQFQLTFQTPGLFKCLAHFCSKRLLKQIQHHPLRGDEVAAMQLLTTDELAAFRDFENPFGCLKLLSNQQKLAMKLCSLMVDCPVVEGKGDFGREFQ